MPNWCVGTLKVRGEQENIRKFLLGAFEAAGSMIDVIKNAEVPAREIDEDEYFLNISAPKGRVLHLKGTRRNFIESDIEWDKEQNIVVFEDFQAAWAVDTEGLTRLSQVFLVDIKIYAFERGMQYNIDFEVHKGTVIKDEEITFSDYEWECPCPNLGG